MKNTVIITGLALAVSAFTLTAQPGPRGGGCGRGAGGPPADGQRPPACPVLGVIDADQDHALSPAELAHAPAALASLDANGDGVLTPDEIRPAPRRGAGFGAGAGNDAAVKERPGRGPQGRGPGGPAGAGPGAGARPLPPWLAGLDADGDRVLNANEIANAAAALLTLDQDGDGLVSPAELRPGGRGPGGRGQHGPGGGPHGPRGAGGECPFGQTN